MAFRFESTSCKSSLVKVYSLYRPNILQICQIVKKSFFNEIHIKHHKFSSLELDLNFGFDLFNNIDSFLSH